MLLDNGIEDLHDDGFEGSKVERCIFREIFFRDDTGSSTSKKCVVTGVINFECESSKNIDTSFCSNSENSAATSNYSSKNTCVEELSTVTEDFREASELVYFPKQVVSSNRDCDDASGELTKDSVYEVPNSECDLGKVSPAIPGKNATEPSSEVVTLRLVESSSQGVTSSCYLLKQHGQIVRACTVGDPLVSSKGRVPGLEGIASKDVSIGKAIASPVSQESFASRTRPQLLEANLEDALRPKMEFLKSLGFSGASMVKLVTKDPRMLDCDLVESVQLFRARGFSDEQIKGLTMKLPSLHFYNVNKIVKPKLEFFKSMGFTAEDVARIVSSEPYILERSLENHIIPCIEVLKRVLGTDENVRKVIKACYWILEYNLEKMLEPNIAMLKSHGVPENIIMNMFLAHPRTFLLRPQQITEILAEVEKLGFNPNTSLFVLAIRSMAVMSKTLWEQKVEAYKSFGLTEDQVYTAFKLQPMCMITSEKKIKKVMHFLINKLNMDASMICRNPNLLMLSLEKRLIPRSSVLQLLISSGFLKEDINIIYYLRMPEQQFVEKLVRKYKPLLPNIVNAHEGRIEFLGFPVILKS